MQVGSDGQGCATGHFHADADSRAKSQDGDDFALTQEQLRGLLVFINFDDPTQVPGGRFADLFANAGRGACAPYHVAAEFTAGFFVVEPFDPVLGVFPEKFLEGAHQFRHVQTAVRIDIPGGLNRDHILGGGSEHPGDDLPVNRVADRHLGLSTNQSEVGHILKTCLTKRPGGSYFQGRKNEILGESHATSSRRITTGRMDGRWTTSAAVSVKKSGTMARRERRMAFSFRSMAKRTSFWIWRWIASGS